MVRKKSEIKKAFFILDKEKDRFGFYVACVVHEGQNGYFSTKERLYKEKEKSQQLVDYANEINGISKDEAFRLVSGSMSTGEANIQ